MSRGPTIEKDLVLYRSHPTLPNGFVKAWRDNLPSPAGPPSFAGWLVLKQPGNRLRPDDDPSQRVLTVLIHSGESQSRSAGFAPPAGVFYFCHPRCVSGFRFLEEGADCPEPI